MATELLTDEQYYYKILNVIRQAQQEILLTVFHAKVYPTRNDCPVKHILDSLIQKRRENVFVSVIFAQHNTTMSIRNNNRQVIEYLRPGNIENLVFKQYRLLHAKSILIDRNIAIIGSHNLTKKALFSSAETSIFTTQANVVQNLREYFFHIKLKSQLIW